MTNSVREVNTIFLPNRISIQLDVLDWAWNVALPRPYPMAHHSGTQHVGNEFVALAIPCEQSWAGAAAAVDLDVVLALVTGNLDFILQHASRPQHAHDVGIFGSTQADNDIERVLSEITAGAIDLKLLPIAAGEDFDLGADGRLVVGESLEQRVAASDSEWRLRS